MCPRLICIHGDPTVRYTQNGLTPGLLSHTAGSDTTFSHTCEVDFLEVLDIMAQMITGGPRLVRILGPGKNRTMRNSY